MKNIYTKFILLTCFITSYSISFSQTDNPCGAPLLTVNSNCVFTGGNLPASATGTTGIPAPGCANYPAAGDDVWYQVTVPTNGSLTIDMNTGSLTDMGMAWYTGTCSSMTLLACNDDGSANGLMPLLSSTSLTPGATIWVRLWEFGADASGTFSICATSPNPPTPCTGGANNSCATADPFCTGTAYNYCNTTGVTGAGTFGCLFSTPNPMWMYINIQTGGNIDILIEQFTTAGTPIDVDFALYGPYSSLAAACPITGTTPQVDCSFSAAPTETANITGATAGQFYMLLITNYNGQAGYIEFSQTGGSGASNCNIVNPTCSSTAVGTNPVCNGGDGTILVSATGGVANFNVSWSGTETGNPGGSEMNAIGGTYTIPSLSPGNYTVTVTDNTGCVSTNSVTIGNPTVVTATESHTNPLCFGGTTTATITASGGTAPYNVSWTGTTSGNPVGNEIAASGGTYNMTGLGAGTYNVTVTGTGGCTATTTVVVTVPTQTTASNTPTHVTCSGLTNGSAIITATGGTAPYNVSWTGTTSGNPIGNEITASGGTYNMTGLGAGTYNVTVTNANGCAATTTVTINPGVVIDANITPIAAQCLTGNSFSFSGSTSTISSGSITSYSWNFGAGASPATGTGVNPPAVTYSAAGTSTVTLTVANGTCTNVETLNITINANPTISTLPTQVACNGGSTGSIAVTGSGATAGYNVSWTGTTTGNPVGNEIAASGGTFNMTGLPAGSYTITLTSANGCTATATVPITQPTLLTASDIETNVVCNGGLTGSGLITGSGGTAPYNVSWTGTTTGNPVGTEIAASGGTFNMTGLGIGTYNVTVTDSQGCTATTTVNITQTTAITLVPSSVNANCGVSNGTASVVASGGTNTFSYVWAPAPGGGQGTPNATGLAAGSYTVTVTDGNLCTANTTIIVGSNLAPIATLVSQVNVLCNGGSTGSAIVSATGGSPGYNVSWTGPTTGNPAGTEIAASGGTFNITGMAAGVYTVTVSDAGTCTAAVNITITQPTPVVASNTTTAVLCFGANNGTAIITGSGGTAPYNVSWNGTTTGNPAGTEIASSGGTFTIPALGVGTYNVTVTDANGCSATTTATVTQPTAITITSANSINALCFGNCNGSVNATATGGTGTLVFNWVTVGTGANQTGLCAGNYNLIVTDANNCSASQTVVVGQPTVLSATTTVVNANCGSANGLATVVPSGGIGGYTFSWGTTPVQTGATATGLIPGVYNITVTDANLCTSTTTATVGNNTAGSVNVITNNNVSCFGASDGQMTATMVGGAPTFTYSWNTTPAQTTATATGVGPGTYTVTVTDFNGCIVTGTTTVTEPTDLVVSTLATDVSCPGGNDGTVSSTITGGTSAYGISWSNGPVSGNITGLTANTYTITVTDGNGCIETSTSIVSQPAPFVINFNTVDINCKDDCTGSSDAILTGGTLPYNYAWNDALTQTTQMANFLCDGTYNVIITDDNGCIATGNTTVNEPTQLVLTTTSINANCGQADGQACVVASGGAGGYTYLWNTGQTISCLNNILAGTYVVDVTDANGCTETVSITVLDLNGPSATILAQTNVSCFGLSDGTATVDMVGGSGFFTVQWDPTAGSQSTPTASNLPAGTYGVTITDALGCNASTSVIITEPNDIVYIPTSTDPSCYNYCDGIISIAVAGGTTPYTYSWFDALIAPIGINSNSVSSLCDGSYSLVLSDANGCTENINYTITEPVQITGVTVSDNVTCNGACNGNSDMNVATGFAPYSFLWNDPSGQTTQTATNLCAGTYDVLVTDDNGCFETFTSTITEPPLLTSSITVFGNVSCSGSCDGFAQIDFVGGVAPYQILWSNGSSNQVATNLCSGSYDVTVTDANGCTSLSTIVITTPNPLVLVESQVNLLCNDVCIGEASVVASGGTTPYNYQWNNPTFDTNPEILNQCAGTYTVLVTDDNGCTASSIVTITEPVALDFTYVSQNSNCNQANGQICTNQMGGVAPFFYQWDDPFLQTSACAFNITAGCYNLTLTDGNGCVKDSLICINDIAGPTINLVSFTDVTCQGANDGTIAVAVSGGVGALTIEWYDGANTLIPTFTNLTSVNNLNGDTYGVTVTDTAGCLISLTQFIFEPNSVFAAVTATTQPLCFGGCDGTATVSASGGDGNYTYLWNAGSASTVANNSGLCVGPVSVTVSDGNGCSFTTSATITQPTLITANTTSATNVTCFGFCNGSVIVSANGATPPYTYNWTLGASTGPTATNLCPNSYTTVITDANGCFTALINNISEPGQLVIATSTVNSTCTQCNGEATAIVSGGTAPFNYQWSSGASLTTAANSGLCPGAHTINITDGNGCTISGSATVIDEAGPTITGMNFTQPLCSGLSNGTATVNTNGGIGQIIYDWNDPASQNTQTAFGLITGNYCVSIQDQNGCPASQCINVTQPNPLNAIGDLDATICFGDSTQVWASGQGGTAPYTINWSTAGMSGTGPIMVYPAVSTNYCFNVTDVNGCASPNECIVITVTPPLTMTLTPPSEICDQGSISVVANASGGNSGPYTFTWTDDNGNPITSTQTGNSSTIVVSPTVATWYYVTLTDGCTTPITDSTLISVNALPVLFVNVVDANGCEPFTAQFIVNSDIGVTYDYDFQCDGTIDLANTTNTNPTSTYPLAGTYDVCVTVTSADGCSTTSSNIGMVTVFPVPVADFTFSPTTATILSPIIDFTNTTAGGSTYSWDFGDGNILPAGSGNIANGTHSGTTSGTYMNPTHIYGDTGTYTITLTATNQFGCTDVISYNIIIEGEYVIYVPNSFTPDGDGINDDFFPQGIGIDRDNFKFMIFNRWGELIFETENPDNHWDGKYKGILSQTDVYVWKIQTRDEKNLPHDHIGHVTLLK
jgi:gliding motility-associated-like protein